MMRCLAKNVSKSVQGEVESWQETIIRKMGTTAYLYSSDHIYMYK